MSQAAIRTSPISFPTYRQDAPSGSSISSNGSEGGSHDVIIRRSSLMDTHWRVWRGASAKSRNGISYGRIADPLASPSLPSFPSARPLRLQLREVTLWTLVFLIARLRSRLRVDGSRRKSRYVSNS